MINASLATTMGLDQGGLNPMWDSSVAGVTEEELNKRLESLLDCFSVDIPRNERMDAPAAMTVQLKEYQRIGVAWMTKMETGNVHGGILSDEMGLGKVGGMWRKGDICFGSTVTSAPPDHSNDRRGTRQSETAGNRSTTARQPTTLRDPCGHASLTAHTVAKRAGIDGGTCAQTQDSPIPQRLHDCRTEARVCRQARELWEIRL